MRLGGEVDDRVDLLAPQRLLGGLRVADVALDEDDPVLDVGQVGSVAGVGEDVVDDDMVLGVLFDPVAGEVRPDETGTSRDEKAHSGGHISPGPGPLPCRGSGRRCTTSPALTGRGARGGLDHQVPGVVDGGRQPGQLLTGQVTRTAWPSVAQRRRTSSARTPPPAASSRSGRRGASASSSVVEQHPPVHRLRRRRPRRPGRSPRPPPGPARPR